MTAGLVGTITSRGGLGKPDAMTLNRDTEMALPTDIGLIAEFKSTHNLPLPMTAARSPLFRTQASLQVAEVDGFNDAADSVSDKIQSVLSKADDVILSRAMRFVNHAPVIATLGTMMCKMGAKAQWRFGLDIAPSTLSFSGVAGACFGAVGTGSMFSLVQ